MKIPPPAHPLRCT